MARKTFACYARSVSEGPQLATVLRGRRANLPIILVSGYIGSMISDLAASAGVGEILKKPVHAQELASSLARVLGRAA